jgi:hypothetical protein
MKLFITAILLFVLGERGYDRSVLLFLDFRHQAGLRVNFAAKAPVLW